MEANAGRAPIELFSACPPSSNVEPELYRQKVVEIAQWSEHAGCKGILVYADNNQIDPWLVSHIIIQSTRSLCPRVAVQPIYMHPYSVAKMVTSFAHLYGRQLYLNMVAGGFKNDLTALNDATPHDIFGFNQQDVARQLLSPTQVSSRARNGEPFVDGTTADLEESFQIRSGVESLKLDAVRSTSRVARLVAKKRRKSVSVAASEAAQR